MVLRSIISRSIHTTRPMANNSPSFSSSVVKAVKALYPQEISDRSFDNTGLLLEAPHQPHLKNHVLLTIDLTKAVADEAIEKKSSVIVAYHPIIFRGLKALTLANSQQNSLLRLAQEGISVYSPHTAVDAASGGLGDWLAEVVTGKPGSAGKTPAPIGGDSTHEISVIKSVNDAPAGFEEAGHGRVVRFNKPQPLGTLISRITSGLGVDYVSVAVPQSISQEEKSNIPISTVGICAGSGGDLLDGLDVDLLFTGEISHHPALAAIEKGKVVITTFHSNSERAFLNHRMKPYLEEKLSNILGEGTKDFQIEVSQADKDPFEIVGKAGW